MMTEVGSMSGTVHLHRADPFMMTEVRANEDPANERQDDRIVTLRRTLGIASGVGLLVGSIIGSGIFATPKWVLIYSGSVGLSLVVWALCGLISLLGALCYVELGLLIPKSGGGYAYVMEAFGPLAAFLFSWVYSLFLKPAASAILLLVFASYVIEPFFEGCSDREDLVLLQKLLAVSALGKN